MQRNGKDKGAKSSERFMRVKRLIETRRNHGEDAARLEELTLARQLVDPNRLLDERDLDDTKFIQYRYMTPYAATELFANEFDRLWRRYMDLLGIKRARGPAYALAFYKDRIVSGLWRARQVADALGIPYGVFIKSGMEQMLQESGKKRLPMPNQLCGEAQIERVLNVWAEPDERFVVPVFEDDWDPRFFVENFADDPVQRAAFDCIDQRIKDAGSFGIQRFCYLAGFINRTMPEAEARRRYGDQMADDALEELARLGGHKTRPDAIVPLTYEPTCFGYAHDPDDPKCQACAVAVACVALRDAAKHNLVARTGTDDPRGAKLRESSRLRQQAYRRRKRETLSSNEPEQAESVTSEVTSGTSKSNNVTPIATRDSQWAET